VWQWPAVFWIRYPLTGVGAMLVTVSLPMFIANGVTRRQYLAGAVEFGVAVCTITAAMTVLGFLAERFVYFVSGADTDLVDQQPLRFGVVYLLLLCCYPVSGTLIGATLARFAPLVVPWLVTIFVAPIVAGEILLGTWWGGVEDGHLRDWLSLWVSAPLVVALIAAASAGVYVLTRDVAIGPKKG
jgi:hypothetical protein